MTTHRTILTWLFSPSRNTSETASSKPAFAGPTELSDKELAQVVGGPAYYCYAPISEGRFCYLGRDSRYAYGAFWL